MNDSQFFDTNVLIYAFKSDDRRSDVARELLEEGGVISVQVLNEFVAVTRRKLKMPWEEVEQALDSIVFLCREPLPLTLETHHRALQIAKRYEYRIYDSLMIATALEAECKMLFSEDMRDGQKISGLTIRNPFAVN